MKQISFQHHLPDVNFTEDDCIADFSLRDKQRTSYPGACSLEYQDLVRILIEDLLQWDPVKQESKGKGILGSLLASAGANEEQGRNTLHSHWQFWTKELDSEIRDALFDNDPQVKNKARRKFINIIDQIAAANLGDDFEVIHDCEAAYIHGIHHPESLEYTSDKHFTNREDQVFRDARNKILAPPLKGRVTSCIHCKNPISTSDIINLALQGWKDIALQHGSNIQADLPFKSARMDIAAYTYSYHMDRKCFNMTDPFWGNKSVRDILLHYTFDEHAFAHKPSCFKKGNDCRFYLPINSNPITDIYEDPDKKKYITTYKLVEGNETIIPAWSLELRRPMGCQYINTHCKPISEVFNCNTNIRVGDRSQIYYSTLYCNKSTQKEDAERVQRINNWTYKRLLRIEDQVLQNARHKEEVPDGFVEGLCRMLSAMNAATTRNVVSATMAHLLVCMGGSRFMFSHGFGNLLIGQLEAALEGQDIDVRVRVNKYKGETILWPDSSSDDYIHRPDSDEFNGMCSYKMCMYYKKIYKSKKEISCDDNDDDYDNDIQDYDRAIGQGYKTKKYNFSDSHPGNKFSHLAELKKCVIPKAYIPENSLCRIKELKLEKSDVDKETYHLRERYAKMALLMFYPHRCLNDLKVNDSYWEMFAKQLTCHRESRPTNFWKKGFEILQNIENRQAMDDGSERATDRITNETECKEPDTNTKHSYQNREEGQSDLNDILNFCDDER